MAPLACCLVWGNAVLGDHLSAATTATLCSSCVNYRTRRIRNEWGSKCRAALPRIVALVSHLAAPLSLSPSQADPWPTLHRCLPPLPLCLFSLRQFRGHLVGVCELRLCGVCVCAGSVCWQCMLWLCVCAVIVRVYVCVRACAVLVCVPPLSCARFAAIVSVN